MIDDAVGWIHLALAVGALALGLLVVARRKGDRLHRVLGRLYVAAMVGLNGTALAIYDLFGGFGPFHWAALLSLATVAAGLLPAVTRRPRRGWYRMHARLMAWSYVGLVAAAVSEAATRIEAVPFAPGVIVGSALVFGTGGWLIHGDDERRLEAALRRAGIRLSPRS